jgi:hypothetical protein
MLRLTSLVGLALVLGALSARADLGPEPGYVELCTLERQQAPGERCILCRSSYHGAPHKCEEELKGRGFAQRCRTAGASTWKEVWCNGPIAAPAPKPAAAPPPPAPSRAPVVFAAVFGTLALAGGLLLWRARGRANAKKDP